MLRIPRLNNKKLPTTPTLTPANTPSTVTSASKTGNSARTTASASLPRRTDIPNGLPESSIPSAAPRPGCNGRPRTATTSRNASFGLISGLRPKSAASAPAPKVALTNQQRTTGPLRATPQQQQQRLQPPRQRPVSQGTSQQSRLTVQQQQSSRLPLGQLNDRSALVDPPRTSSCPVPRTRPVALPKSLAELYRLRRQVKSSVTGPRNHIMPSSTGTTANSEVSKNRGPHPSGLANRPMAIRVPTSNGVLKSQPKISSQQLRKSVVPSSRLPPTSIPVSNAAALARARAQHPLNAQQNGLRRFPVMSSGGMIMFNPNNRYRPVRRPNGHVSDPYGLNEMTDEDRDFIDDGPLDGCDHESEDWRRKLRQCTGYYPSNYIHEVGEAVESDIFKVQTEERISSLVAQKEDLEEYQKIQQMNCSDNEEDYDEDD